MCFTALLLVLERGPKVLTSTAKLLCVDVVVVQRTGLAAAEASIDSAIVVSGGFAFGSSVSIFHGYGTGMLWRTVHVRSFVRGTSPSTTVNPMGNSRIFGFLWHGCGRSIRRNFDAPIFFSSPTQPNLR